MHSKASQFLLRAFIIKHIQNEKKHENKTMKSHANTMMVAVAMLLGVAEGANMIRLRNTRSVDAKAMELGMADAVEEEMEKNLELDHYFRRTLQSSMASMPGYSKVTIQNDTPYDTTNGPSEGINPYDTFVYYSAFCETDYIPEGIRTGYMWTGPRRGGCLVEKIYTTLARPGGNLVCDNYYSSVGTTHADYFIILIDGKCCVRSSYQTLTECP